MSSLAGRGLAPKFRRVGVIDVGSNSVRLVIYDVCGRAMQPRFNEKVMAGLGRGLTQTGRLGEAGVVVAVESIERFAAVMKAQNVEQVLGFATAAVRDAADGASFCERVRRQCGVKLRVLTGEDEARLSAVGVLAGSPGVSGVSGDLGGSSLELSVLRDGAYAGGSTYALGPLALETPGPIVPAELFDRIRARLKASEELAKAGGGDFFAVGGAWRAIASIHMRLNNAPLHVLHNYEMPPATLTPLLTELVSPKGKLASLVATIGKRRAPTLPYAAAVLRQLLESGRFTNVIVSSYGVREGIVLESLGPPSDHDEILAAGLDAQFGADPEHSQFGSALFDWLEPLRPRLLPDRLLRAACRLVEVGALYHPDHRAELAFELVSSAPLPGLTHRDRAVLALAVASRFRRGVKNRVTAKLVDPAMAQKARALGALMRLGADFSGRTASLLKLSRLEVAADTLLLHVPQRHAALASELVARRLEQAAIDLRLKPRMEIDRS